MLVMFIGSLLSVAGRIMISQHVHILIPRTCKYITSHDKRDVTDVTKVKALRQKIVQNYMFGSNLITWVLKSREPFLV